MESSDKYVIYDRNDGHLVDTAGTLSELGDKSWWRTGVGIATRVWWEKYGPQTGKGPSL